jgi:hypothetical protein
MNSNWIRFPAIVLLGVVVLAVMLWMRRECSAQAAQQAMQNMYALGCADYWFGRYQLLFGLLLLIPALASVRSLLGRHLANGARDRALLMQEVWIRRSRELLGAAALAAEAARMGTEILKGAPAVASIDNTKDIDATADVARAWLMRLSVLEGKADEAYAGFVGGPEISGSLKALAEALSQVRQRMNSELEALSVSTPPRRYAGSSVVEGQEVFVHAAKEFGACGREIAQAGESLRTQIEEERSRVHHMLLGLDRRVFG